MRGWMKMKWWDGPVRGHIHLAVAILFSAYHFFLNDGRRGVRHPTMFEQFQTGSPSDFVVLVSLGMIIWIGYAVAVLIVDYRDGRI